MNIFRGRCRQKEEMKRKVKEREVERERRVWGQGAGRG